MRVTSNRRKEKFYVVFHGLQPGIYTSWQECAPHVIGVSRSLYKSYDTMEEALHAFNHANNLPMNSYRGGDGMSLVASSGISTTLGNEEPCQQYLSTINMESKKSLMFGKEDPREESPSINAEVSEMITLLSLFVDFHLFEATEGRYHKTSRVVAHPISVAGDAGKLMDLLILLCGVVSMGKN
ncbi:hypothetical protein GH714_029686 [Hevea brasiliensis]|uniref:Ribonuclease H1 N-terminal domain-containing protein n=1 Tax=Hevea brasiliensis TaxID=3981 RepID=A0A6A6LP24_HEVBR|nr:hypothetical protein GH714_029686 [Hevea brasiliensis]